MENHRMIYSDLKSVKQERRQWHKSGSCPGWPGTLYCQSTEQNNHPFLASWRVKEFRVSSDKDMWEASNPL